MKQTKVEIWKTDGTAASARKPYNNVIGYVSSRLAAIDRLGHALIFDTEAGFKPDFKAERWVVVLTGAMHLKLSFPSSKEAYEARDTLARCESMDAVEKAFRKIRKPAKKVK